MKIVSYNISQCTQCKVDYLLAMDADLYIVPECAAEESVRLPEGYNMLWTGDENLRHKGLGVIWRNHLNVTVAEECKRIKHHLPLFVDCEGFSMFVLACWPTILNEKKSYPQLLLEAIREYSHYLKSSCSLAIGDFNCFLGQGGVSKKTGTFEDCIREFDKYSMKSLYHAQIGEEFGRESEHTFYWHFNEKYPFFLDYAFCNVQPKIFKIGEWEKGISDHRPLLLEI